MFEAEHMVSLHMVKAHRSQHGVKCQDKTFFYSCLIKKEKKRKFWKPKEEQESQHPNISSVVYNCILHKNNCMGGKLIPIHQVCF